MTLRQSALYPILLCGFLMGCGRGCTTTSKVDSESITVVKKGKEITLEACVIDYRYSVGKKNNIFNRSVSHTFGLRFEVALYGKKFGNFFTEDVDDPDNVDLTSELKRIKVDLSKDKKHLGLGVDGKVVQVIHIYKKRPIKVEIIDDSNIGKKWSELDLDAMPSPKLIIMNAVSANCDFLLFDNAIAMEMLDDYHPSDTMHRMLLSKWPDCRLAEDYLTEKRTKRLSKNATWKRYAVKRGLEVIEKNSLSPWELEGISDFLNMLNSPKLSRAIDSLYMADWGRKGSQTETAALIERIQSKKRPMNATLKREVLDDARANFKTYMRTGESDSKRESSYCLAILIAGDDKEIGQIFLEDGFTNNMKKYDNFDFFETVYDNFEVFTADQQDFILDNTSKLFENSRDYSRSSLYRAVTAHASCDQLKKWLESYPEDLDYEELPDSCTAGSKRN
ncbi:MAG: hypothetical protein ACI865_002807 [Flavobacteriaceae bacterium]|jgi:hypothetical protein